MKSNRMLVRMVLLMVTFCGVAVAQDTASLTGTVTDASGAAVQGAQVSLTNSQHGMNDTTSSNGSGDFLFASLPIGSYDLTVTVQGFKKYEAKGIILRVAEKARVNVALEVGAISTEVIVQGSEVAQVDTQSAELEGTITGKEISQLELNGRDYTQLV
ncbi:MAG TPA: carboxypeptidase-like regulatory domain-containing protein, partial [Candidatus Polarisedimenticolia bacterium]|nr:carboxypeptidase-like regulatory domain-containing protein [Candidatus Polarisedimenticolia bacterium]